MPRNSITHSNLRPAGDGPQQSRTAASFFNPVTSKEELDKIINAGKATRNIQQALEQKRINENVAWADEARLMKTKPTPTIVALTEANKNLQDLAKLQQKSAEENKKLIEGLPAGIAGLLPAKKSKTKAIEAPAAPEVEPAPGPTVEDITDKDITQPIAPMNKEYLRKNQITYTTYQGSKVSGLFGKKGNSIVFRPDGDNFKVIVLTKGDDDKPHEVYNTIISKQLYKYIISKETFDFKPDYAKLMTPDDLKQFRVIVDAANGEKAKGQEGDKIGALRRFVRQNEEREGPPPEPVEFEVAEPHEPAVEEPVEGEGFMTPKGTFHIDPAEWAKGKFVVKKGGKVLLSRKYDHTFPKLLSESRINPNYQYSGKSIELYRKFIHHTGIPIPKTSKRYNLVFGPKDELEKLRLNMEGMAAGDKSKDVYNESVALADKLLQQGKFTKEQHDTCLHTLARLSH